MEHIRTYFIILFKLAANICNIDGYNFVKTNICMYVLDRPKSSLSTDMSHIE